MENWLEKYKPSNTKEVIGNAYQITEINDFVKQFTKKKINYDKIKNPNLLVIGPIGIGKSLIVDLVLQENSIEKIYANISEISQKKNKKDGGLSRTVKSYYLFLQRHRTITIDGDCAEKKIALVFDNVSNLNPKKKDIIKTLIKLNNKHKRFPIIIIGNNSYNKMINDLKKMITYTVKAANSNKNIKYVNDVVLRAPEYREIRKYIDKICLNENLQIVKSTDDKNDIFESLIDHSQFDIRRLINILEEIKQMYGQTKITMKIFNDYVETSKKKDIDPGIFDGTKMLLNSYDGIDNTLSIYSGDRSTIPLIIHENYPTNISVQYPKLSVEDQLDLLVDISNCIAVSDKIDGLIHSNQCWNLQKVHGFYSCVMPSYYINQFPGKLSKFEKYVYTKDYNKTSIKKINNKVIKKARENKLLRKLTVTDFLYMCSVLKTLIVKKDVDTLCNLLKPYKFTYLKEIESIISIDKLEKGQENDKLKTKYKIKGKMKSQVMEKLGLREEKTKSKAKAKAKAKAKPKAKPNAKPNAKPKANIKPKPKVTAKSGSKTKKYD